MTAAWTLAVGWAGALWSARAWREPGAWSAVFPVASLAGPGPELVANATRSAAGLAFAVLFLYMCDAAGLTLLRNGGAGPRRGPVRCAAPLVGYLVLGTGLLGVAAVGLWRAAALWPVLGVFAALAWPSRHRAGADWRRAAQGVWRGLSVVGRGATVALAGWLVLLLTPPELTFDPLSYDLAFPQQMLVTGRLFSTEVWSHWVVPLPAEFPFVYPLLAGLDPAARMIALGLAVAGTLAGCRAILPGASARATAVVVVAALALPVARSGLVTAKSDAFAIGYAAAAVGVLLGAGAFGAGRLVPVRFACGALLLGGMVAVKFLTLPLAAAIMLVIVVRRAIPERPGVAAGLAAAGLAPILPWISRAWLGTGDPLPPIGWAVFPALAPDSETAERTRRLFIAYVRDMRSPLAAPGEALAMLWTNAWPLVAAAPWIGRASGPLRALLIATLAGYAGLVLGIRGAIEHVERFCHPAFTVLLLVAFGRLAASPRGTIRAVRWPVAVAVALAVAGLGRFEWWPGASLQRLHARYHLGALAPGAMRNEGMLAYGAILPRLRAECSSRPGRTVVAVGEFQFWDIPARVRTSVFEPPVVWRAVHGARTPERVGIRLRQSNAGLLLHNQYLSDWARHTDAPYGWDGRMLRVWMDYARGHLVLLDWSRRIDPHYGSPWLYAIRPRAGAAPARVPFLPGIEPGLAYASLAAAHGDHAAAADRFAALARSLPGLAHLDALRGGSLLRLGRTGEALAWLRAADRAGVVTEWSLLDLAVAAGRTGREAEARAVLDRASRILPGWPDRVAAARW